MRRGIHYKVTLLGIMVVSYFILSGRSGGCDEDNVETLKSPVQAVATVIEGASGAVRAELVLISTLTSSHRFIDSAEEVELEVPGNTERLTLRQTSPGHYAVTSVEDTRLVYQPGGTYLFKFQLDDVSYTGEEYAGGYFVGEVTAPDDRPASLVAVQDTPGRDHACTIDWSPAFSYGLYSVLGPDGAVTDSNWDFSQPQFDGSKWESLLRASPSDHLIAGQAFQEVGSYTLTYAGCSFVQGFQDSLSSQLGLLSGFLACSEIEAQLEVP